MSWVHPNLLTLCGFVSLIVIFVGLMIANAADFSQEMRWWENEDENDRTN